MKPKKKYEIEEKALYNAVQVYRSRGNYLQRLELFEKAIQAYDEALKWNNDDARSLIGRSIARSKATHYAGALADAAKAAELEPENLSALQIRALTEYEKCAFERSLVLAHRGQRLRKTPPDFATCARIAEETIRECIGKKSSQKVLSSHIRKTQLVKSESIDENVPQRPQRVSRMQTVPTEQIQESTRIEEQRSQYISHLMASMYLQRMAHDKYFLTSLCKDERLKSANVKGSTALQQLANQALADLVKRQEVLRDRRPLYEARAAEEAAAARLSKAHKELVARTMEQHVADANRLIQSTKTYLEKHETAKCLEHAEFAMEQLSRKPASKLPGKEKFLQELQTIVAEAFLQQKRTSSYLSESDLEKRAFILLGIALSREPSRDSVLRERPPEPPRDAKQRQRKLEKALTLAARTSERCYLLHELSRLLINTKQPMKARFYAAKCQSESKAAGQQLWLLNATFLLARCHVQQNNRPEARAALTEGATLARSYRMSDVGEFFEICANVSTEGESAATEAALEAREKAMISLMQDDDMKVAATYLFKKMSVIPTSRRFSVMPGAKMEETGPQSGGNRRKSIVPNAQQPTTISKKSKTPLGLQDFDY